MTEIALTTSHTLLAYSSVSVTETTAGLGQGYDFLPPTRPLISVFGTSAAIATMSFEALESGDFWTAIDFSSDGSKNYGGTDANGVFLRTPYFREGRMTISGPGGSSFCTTQSNPTGFYAANMYCAPVHFNQGDFGMVTLLAYTQAGYTEVLVPEPSTALLLLSGALILAIKPLRHRKRVSGFSILPG